ncbi:MAG: hypothetical protein M1831_005767 [Alyxoria varia]|nr:MAG: hypothetical protein M1831_005767 [Alyxoria varia]
MGREEQKEEREVLDSIFPDEIHDVSDTEYRISITLDAPEQSDEDAEPFVLVLRVQYPEAYPDIAPDLDLSTLPNAPKHDNLDVHDDKPRLLEALQATIEENLGMAMVFTLVSALKENAESLIAERLQVVQAEKDKEAAKAEEEEDRKFHGESVTRESFLAWRETFQNEMEELERRRQEDKEAEDKKKKVPKEEKKLTGRELWEKGLAGKMEEDDEGEDIVESMEITKLGS